MDFEKVLVKRVSARKYTSKMPSDEDIQKIIDAALHANKLSVVFEDLAAARETLDRVREFVKNNPTIYLSTHTDRKSVV